MATSQPLTVPPELGPLNAGLGRSEAMRWVPIRVSTNHTRPFKLKKTCRLCAQAADRFKKPGPLFLRQGFKGFEHISGECLVDSLEGTRHSGDQLLRRRLGTGRHGDRFAFSLPGSRASRSAAKRGIAGIGITGDAA